MWINFREFHFSFLSFSLWEIDYRVVVSICVCTGCSTSIDKVNLTSSFASCLILCNKKKKKKTKTSSWGLKGYFLIMEREWIGFVHLWSRYFLLLLFLFFVYHKASFWKGERPALSGLGFFLLLLLCYLNSFPPPPFAYLRLIFSPPFFFFSSSRLEFSIVPYKHIPRSFLFSFLHLPIVLRSTFEKPLLLKNHKTLEKWHKVRIPTKSSSTTSYSH